MVKSGGLGGHSVLLCRLKTLQKAGLVLQELPITHGKGSLPGPTRNVEIDFYGIDFEIKR